MFVIGAFIELFWDEVFMVFVVATCTYSCRICVREFYGTDQFGSTKWLGTTFERVRFWPVWSFRLVGPKCPFSFDKIVVPSTALLYPSYKNNNQKRGGLGRICATGMYLSIGHVDFPKFQSGICVEWKVLLIYRVIKSKPVSKVFVSEQLATTLLRARENIAKTGFCKVVTVCHPFSLLRI